MFPPFVDSFGNQFTAVLINMIGSVLGGFLNAIFGSFVTIFITPFFENIASGVGLPA